jgi:hypothetical protein
MLQRPLRLRGRGLDPLAGARAYPIAPIPDKRVITLLGGEVRRDLEAGTRASLMLRRNPQMRDALDGIAEPQGFGQVEEDWRADWFPPDYVRNSREKSLD